MKAEHLMIKSLVKLNDESYHDLEHDGVLNDKNNIWIVKKIDEDGDINIYNEIENLFEFSNIEDIEPIPLTEEWLLKFGFESIAGCVYKEFGSIEIGLMKSSKRFYLQIRSENTTIDIKYIHDLQNLWKVLTKEELTLKNEGL